MIVKIRKKYLYFGAIIFIAAMIAFLLLYKNQKSEAYVDGNGMLAIAPLSPVDYKTTLYEANDNYKISKIVYNNFGKDIYGFLAEPVSRKITAGIVLLPGAGVDKKSELELAKRIALQGYAVITIDQRGVGETNGNVPPLEEDFNSYIKGSIAVQHLMILDALAAADVLREEKKENGKVIMIGESLGGRVALISAAVDKRIKGVIAISAAGFHISADNKGDIDKEQLNFMKSLDPDNYMAEISPRKIFMFHNTYDRNVPFDSALVTFEKAKEPKEFIVVNDTKCNHGFCDSMFHDINSSLAAMIR